jgi:hypothetical protein
VIESQWSGHTGVFIGKFTNFIDTVLMLSAFWRTAPESLRAPIYRRREVESLPFHAQTAQQAQEFGASGGVGAEGPEHGAGDRVAVLLFYSTHHHAEVGSFDNHGDPVGFEDFHQGFRNLGGESLLHLQTAREHIDHTRDLGETYDFLFRDVGDMGFSCKREQVMLTKGVKFNVSYNDDFTGIGFEKGVPNDLVDVLSVAGRQKTHRLGRAARSIPKALARPVFTQQLQSRSDIRRNLGVGIGVAVLGREARRRLFGGLALFHDAVLITPELPKSNPQANLNEPWVAPLAGVC